MVPDKHLARVAGANQTLQGLISIVAPPLGALLLDVQRAGTERRVVVALVLLLDRLHGLGLDAGLLGVVDAAGQVAVGAGVAQVDSHVKVQVFEDAGHMSMMEKANEVNALLRAHIGR